MRLPSAWTHPPARAAAALLRRSLRFAPADPRPLSRARRLSTGGGHIYAILHRDTLCALLLLMDEPHACIVSPSRIGDLLSSVLERRGYALSRGSPSRDGARALVSMVRDMNARGLSGVVAVDGSRGPAGVAKPGIVAAARLTGLPIVPLSVSPDRFWELRTWDRLRLPKPFSTIVARRGEPIPVPRDAGPGETAGILRRLDRELGGAGAPGR